MSRGRGTAAEEEVETAYGRMSEYQGRDKSGVMRQMIRATSLSVEEGSTAAKKIKSAESCNVEVKLEPE